MASVARRHRIATSMCCTASSRLRLIRCTSSPSHRSRSSKVWVRRLPRGGDRYRPQVRQIARSRDQRRGPGHVVRRGVLISLGRIVWIGRRTARVANNRWASGLNGQWLTYVLTLDHSSWRIAGVSWEQDYDFLTRWSVGVDRSSAAGYSLASASASGRRSLFRARAFRATRTLEPLIEIAPISGRRVNPIGAKTPAAMGRASEL